MARKLEILARVDRYRISPCSPQPGKSFLLDPHFPQVSFYSCSTPDGIQVLGRASLPGSYVVGQDLQCVFIAFQLDEFESLKVELVGSSFPNLKGDELILSSSDSNQLDTFGAVADVAIMDACAPPVEVDLLPSLTHLDPNLPIWVASVIADVYDEIPISIFLECFNKAWHPSLRFVDPE
ncbi:hypothetical protein JTB14_010405 [Gonioctena quinquepunctata]|nr:hypothetical protein JTB14_010405 [Gonioctena quinquepunctata]